MNLFSLLPSPAPASHRIDRKFLSAYRYLKICLTAKTLYLLLKMTISLIFLPLISDPLYYAWLLWLFAVSCLQTGYNTYLLGRYTHRHAKLQIASALGFLETVKFDLDFPSEIGPSDGSGEERVEDITGQYQAELQLKTTVNAIENLMERLCPNLQKARIWQYCLFQSVQLLGCGLLLLESSEQFCRIFVVCVLYIGIYEYMEDYLCFAFGLVYFPCVFVFDLFKKSREKWQTYRIVAELKPFSFGREGQVKGESECLICLQSYREGERLVRLRCSDVHHFHEECIRQWVGTANSCPACRALIQGA